MPLELAEERERDWVARARARDVSRRGRHGALHDFDAFFVRLWAHYAEASAWRLARGARQCLDALAARGLRLGVLSNFDQRPRRVLASLRVAERFAVITLPADAGAAKPARAIVEHCLARLGLAAANVLYVGDRSALDAAAARQAGWLAFEVGDLSDLTELS